MFREVYAQPLYDIRQSSICGIEKHSNTFGFPIVYKTGKDNKYFM